MSIASAACLGNDESGLDRLAPDPPRRIERDDRERRQQLGGDRDRDHDGGRALLEERNEQLVRCSQAPRALRIEHQRLARAEETATRQALQLLRALEQRQQRVGQAGIGHVGGPRDELVAALLGNADHGRIDPEQVDRRAHDGFQGGLERETGRERARDLVQRAQLAGSCRFGGQGAFPFRCQALHVLVEASVLHRDRELAGQRGEQCRLARRRHVAERQVDGHDADQLLADEQRDGSHALDARLQDGIPDCSQP